MKSLLVSLAILSILASIARAQCPAGLSLGTQTNIGVPSLACIPVAGGSYNVIIGNVDVNGAGILGLRVSQPNIDINSLSINFSSGSLETESIIF